MYVPHFVLFRGVGPGDLLQVKVCYSGQDVAAKESCLLFLHSHLERKEDTHLEVLQYIQRK